MQTAKHDGPLEVQPSFLEESADVDALLSGLGIGLDLAPQSRRSAT